MTINYEHSKNFSRIYLSTIDQPLSGLGRHHLPTLRHTTRTTGTGIWLAVINSSTEKDGQYYWSLERK